MTTRSKRRADGLVDARRGLWTKAKEQRDVEVHDEPLGGRDGGRLLQLARLHAELHDMGSRGDQVDAGCEDPVGDPAEEVLHAHVAGRHDRRRGIEDDEHDQGDQPHAEVSEHGEERAHSSVLLIGRKSEAI